MCNGAVAERQKTRQKRKSFSSHGWLGSCVAGSWKRFESFSICDLFSKCVCSAHMLPACTCRRSQCLKLQPLDYVTIPLLPTCHSAPNSPCPARVTRHMDVIADKRKLMHVESMAAPTQNSHLLICQWHSYAFTQSYSRVCLLFTGGGISEEYCFRAWDRPWQWCMELHILSFSLINMQLPGAEQMAEPSSPPAGCCRHPTGISVGTTANPGSPLGPGFLPPRLSHLARHRPSQQNWPPDNISLPRHHNQCNKQSKECAMSSTNTDTLCVSRMCQIVSWWHVLILSGVLSVYFFIALFVHELYISKCFMDLWFVLPD